MSSDSNLESLGSRGSSAHSHFGENWRDPLTSLLSEARASGADFCEIFLEQRDYLSVLVENGHVTSVNPTLSKGAGVRLFRGKLDCYVSTFGISQKEIRWALHKAMDILGFKPRNSNDLNPLRQTLVLEQLRDYGALGNKQPWLDSCPSVREAADKLLVTNALLKKKVKHCVNATNSVFRDWQEILVANSDGIFARDIRLNQSFVGSVNCVDKEHRSSISERLGGTSEPNFLRTVDTEELVDELEQSAGVMLRADFVSSGQYPVVMANKFGGVIFHEACGHLLETTAIEKKSTPFLESKGLKIANTAVTAWDEGHTPNAFGTLDIDDEGMLTQSTLLIENGILKNFISDRTGELRTGHSRSGSGRRQNHTFPAASRMRNTFIAGGNHTPEELIASTENGLYCKRMGGGSVGPTGEFNFAVNEGYLIQNGKIGKPVKGATLIGDAKSVMMDISMCANDHALAPGFCGSISGSIYVTVGQPHIKVDKITVGGR